MNIKTIVGHILCCAFAVSFTPRGVAAEITIPVAQPVLKENVTTQPVMRRSDDERRSGHWGHRRRHSRHKRVLNAQQQQLIASIEAKREELKGIRNRFKGMLTSEQQVALRSEMDAKRQEIISLKKQFAEGLSSQQRRELRGNLKRRRKDMRRLRRQFDQVPLTPEQQAIKKEIEQKREEVIKLKKQLRQEFKKSKREQRMQEPSVLPVSSGMEREMREPSAPPMQKSR